MTWLKLIWSEFAGLFVDDGSLAVAVISWLAICFGLSRLPLPAAVTPCVLAGGLLAILAESVVRRSRQRP